MSDMVVPSTHPTRHSPNAVARTEPIEVAFGIALLVLGTFIVLAVSNPLEIAVYAGGPIMAVIGIILTVVAVVKRSGNGPIVFGGTAFLLGSLLAVHDFLFPPGIAVFIHLGIGISTLVLGILQLAMRRRYYSKWFFRRK